MKSPVGFIENVIRKRVSDKLGIDNVPNLLSMYKNDIIYGALPGVLIGAGSGLYLGDENNKIFSALGGAALGGIGGGFLGLTLGNLLRARANNYTSSDFVPAGEIPRKIHNTVSTFLRENQAPIFGSAAAGALAGGTYAMMQNNGDFAAFPAGAALGMAAAPIVTLPVYHILKGSVKF